MELGLLNNKFRSENKKSKKKELIGSEVNYSIENLECDVSVICIFFVISTSVG